MVGSTSLPDRYLRVLEWARGVSVLAWTCLYCRHQVTYTLVCCFCERNVDGTAMNVPGRKCGRQEFRRIIWEWFMFLAPTPRLLRAEYARRLTYYSEHDHAYGVVYTCTNPSAVYVQRGFFFFYQKFWVDFQRSKHIGWREYLSLSYCCTKYACRGSQAVNHNLAGHLGVCICTYITT